MTASEWSASRQGWFQFAIYTCAFPAFVWLALSLHDQTVGAVAAVIIAAHIAWDMSHELWPFGECSMQPPLWPMWTHPVAICLGMVLISRAWMACRNHFSRRVEGCVLGILGVVIVQAHIRQFHARLYGTSVLYLPGTA